MSTQNPKRKLYDADATLRRTHPTETPGPTELGLPHRFITKIQVDPTTGCWIWTAAKGLAGHGRFGNNGGRKATPKVVPAHRFAFEQIIGRLPDRLQLDHLCRRPECCNPWHVEPVTAGENIRRGLAGNSDRKCRRGIHDLSVTGTLDDGNRCAECRRIYDRKRRPKKTNKPAAQFRTHCPHGHPYAGDNLMVRPNGHRECRTCHRERQRAAYHRRKQEAQS